MKVCIQYGHTSKIWQQNRIKILAKPSKYNYNVAKSYRIITLSTNMLKILEKLILWHLQDDLKIEQSPNKTQSGFEKGHSTEAALSTMIKNTRSSKTRRTCNWSIPRHTRGIRQYTNTIN